MKAEVVKHMATFLEACPTQVTTFDSEVVDHLTQNPSKLHAFKLGCDAIKWDIYQSIKYRPAKRTKG